MGDDDPDRHVGGDHDLFAFRVGFAFAGNEVARGVGGDVVGEAFLFRRGPGRALWFHSRRAGGFDKFFDQAFMQSSEGDWTQRAQNFCCRDVIFV